MSNKRFFILLGLLIAIPLIGRAAVTYNEIKAYQLGMLKSKQPVLGATIPVVVTRFQTSLQSSITSSANSMTLVAGTDVAGNSISGFTCFTVDEGTSVAEDVCGSASGTAITSLVRGISPTTGTSSVASLQFAHRRGASVKITDAPQLPILSRILNGNETLPNALTYDSSVSTATLASNLQNVASVKYVNGVAVAGAPNASAAQNGLVQAATGAQLSIGTSPGSSGALLFAPSNLYSSTSSATILIPVTKANGKLAQGFLDLTENFALSGSFTNSSATTTLAATSTKPLILDNLTYSFPFTHGAASATSTLSNNGSGLLTWYVPFSLNYASTTLAAATGGWISTSATTTIASITTTLPITERVMVSLAAGGITNTTNGDGCLVNLYIDNVSQGSVMSLANTAATQFTAPASFSYVTSSLTAASHTFSLGGLTTTGGSCNLSGGALGAFTIFNLGN